MAFGIRPVTIDIKQKYISYVATDTKPMAPSFEYLRTIGRDSGDRMLGPADSIHVNPYTGDDQPVARSVV